MNILILSWRGIGHPKAGGAEIVTHEHAKAWVQAGHSVTLFTSYYEGSKTQEIVDGVKIIRSGYEFLGVRLRVLLWYMFSPHPRYDLVFDHFHGIPFFAPLFARTKVVAFIHELAREVWLLNHLFFVFKYGYGILGYMLEPWIFRLFYRNIPFITVSESTKQEIVSLGIPSSHITVIRNGLSLHTQSNIPQKEKVATLMFLGALTTDKGIVDALKTFSIIHACKKTWNYWVVGDGSEEFVKYLKNLSEQLGISKQVTFWGYVNEDIKYQLFAKAHLIINPTIREGWGLTVIEAAAMGTPTIGYNVPGLRDSVVNGKTGILCKRGDYNQLAEVAMSILDNQKDYKPMCSEAKKWGRSFSWEKSCQESLKAINTLLKSSN